MPALTMLFNSYIFILLFLPLSVLGYYWLKKVGDYSASISFLILASFVFYSWWNPAYLLLILASIMCNYVLGTFLASHRLEVRPRKWLLFAGICANVALLCYYKYLLFFAGILASLTDTVWQPGQVILPLAISFFTFQQIAYLVDASRGETRHYGFLHYCLFVTFFPQLIAGPIVHHKDMMPQFVRSREHAMEMDDVAVGCIIFTLGLFKKVVIADTAAELSTPLFAVVDQGGQLSLLEAWQAAVAYTVQLYFDFSGYCDMAVGAARMFHITLPINFNSPYKSLSIIEFWRRWHISLSNFLRDYLYIALGGNRLGELRRFSNLFITMLLGGLWHGAGWNFVIWGALHGSYLIVNHSWRKLTGSSQWVQGHLYGLAARILTLLCVIVGWVFFRAETTEGAWAMLRAMFGANGVAFPPKYQGRWGSTADWLQQKGVQFYDMEYFTSLSDIWLLLILMLCAITLPNTYQLLSRHEPVIGSLQSSRWEIPLNKYSGIVIGLLMLYCLVSMNKVSEFLYFQF